MSQKPISPLRQRMLEDMRLRGFTPDTQRDYIRAVKKLAAYLGRSPDTATAEDLRAFQLHLTASGVQPPTINTTVTVLRFFFKATLDRPETTRHLVFVYEPRKLPRVLSPEEVLRLLEAAPGPKYKAALSVAYGAGLRAMEVVALKVSDIDSKRMTLRVEQGKGRKDRFAMLSPQLLELLRDWWRIARPAVWMFPGRDRISPTTTRQLNRVCHMAAELASLPRWVAPHTLRHPSAGAEHRHSRASGLARSRDILPTNTRSRGGFTTRSILVVARVCSFSGNTPTVVLSWLSFRSRTGQSPAYPRG